MQDIFQVLARKGAVFAARAIVIAAAFSVAWLIASWAKRAVLRSLEPTPVDATLSRSLANLLRYAIIVAAFVACFGAMGFRTASFGTVRERELFATELVLGENLMIASSRRAS